LVKKKSVFLNPEIEAVLKAAESKKAVHPVVLDLSKKSSFFDYLIVMSGESTPQLKALSEAISEAADRDFQGSAESGWLILDLGDTIVHVMSEEERAYYDIEGIWDKDAVVYHV
jgi:ribosome-associated protein